MTGSSTALDPLWVSFEGLEGVGKTRLTAQLAHRLGPTCCLLTELTDASGEQVPAQVITALAAAGDPFLRTGYPLTETFALLALKVREHEVVAQMTAPPALVLEDRGIDSVAIYQAAILLGADASDDAVWSLAQDLFSTADGWCPLPDLTVLLLDDLEVCGQRWTEREGIPLTTDQRHLVERADRLYQRLAQHQPVRYRVIRRTGRAEADVLDELEATVNCAAIQKRSSHAEAS
ncbi:hypothetical protein [Amycolatopsis pigmentata]|uniref:Thymidylate kinase n=1 Tax=Amycolatopsis pigmentata TaxID=450801 RepID=A0ABW5G8K2_9PSEU